MTGERRLGIGMVGAGTMASAHSLALSLLARIYEDAAATASRGSRRRQRPPRVTPCRPIRLRARRAGLAPPRRRARHRPGRRLPAADAQPRGHAGCGDRRQARGQREAARDDGRSRRRTPARRPGGRRVPRSWRRLSLDAGAPGDPLDAGTGRARRGAQPARVVPARLRRRPRGAAPLALPAIDGRWRDRDRHGLPPRRLRALPGRRGRDGPGTDRDIHRRAATAGCGCHREYRRRPGAGSAAVATGRVDVEDAAAALVTFESGAYGVLETNRAAIGRRVSSSSTCSGRAARRAGTWSAATSSRSASAGDHTVSAIGGCW